MLDRSKANSFTLIEILSAVFLLGILSVWISIKAVDVMRHQREQEKSAEICSSLTRFIEEIRISGKRHQIHISQIQGAMQIMSDLKDRPGVKIHGVSLSPSSSPPIDWVFHEGFPSNQSYELRVQINPSCEELYRVDCSKYPYLSHSKRL